MIDKIKQDKEFRNKVIRIVLIGVVAIVVISIILITSEENQKENSKVIDRTQDIDLIPSDTTSLPEDKSVIYQDDEMFNERKNKTIDLVKEEADFGLSPEEIKKREEEEAQTIEDYWEKRRKQAGVIQGEAQNNQKLALEANSDYLTVSGVPNDSPSNVGNVGGNTGHTREQRKKKTKEELEAEYYAKLIKLRQERKAKIEKKEIFEFRAVFYRDQFVMPGERARLILPNQVTIGNKIFEKGTDIYATVSINKSRVLFTINNINHYPLEMVVKDLQDGEEGIYSEEAGKMWREYQSEMQENAIEQLGSDVQRELHIPLVSTTINSIKTFFSKKKYSDKEKILLLNDHEVILTNDFDKNDEKYKDNINN